MGNFFEVSFLLSKSLPYKAKAGLILLIIRNQMKPAVFRIIRYGINKAFGVCLYIGGSQTAGYEYFGCVAIGSKSAYAPTTF